MKKIYLLLVIILPGLVAVAQRGSVKGTLTDTLAKQPVASATLTLLAKKDSSLV